MKRALAEGVVELHPTEGRNCTKRKLGNDETSKGSDFQAACFVSLEYGLTGGCTGTGPRCSPHTYPGQAYLPRGWLPEVG